MAQTLAAALKQRVPAVSSGIPDEWKAELVVRERKKFVIAMDGLHERNHIDLDINGFPTLSLNGKKLKRWWFPDSVEKSQGKYEFAFYNGSQNQCTFLIRFRIRTSVFFIQSISCIELWSNNRLILESND
jgi:predicted transcriptional regulator